MHAQMPQYTTYILYIKKTNTKYTERENGYRLSERECVWIDVRRDVISFRLVFLFVTVRRFAANIEFPVVSFHFEQRLNHVVWAKFRCIINKEKVFVECGMALFCKRIDAKNLIPPNSIKRNDVWMSYELVKYYHVFDVLDGITTVWVYYKTHHTYFREHSCFYTIYTRINTSVYFNRNVYGTAEASIIL